MRKKILFLLLIFSVVGFSQETKKIEIIKIGQKYSKQEISTAFETANLCAYTFFNKENLVILDDGSQVKILSANNNGVNQKDCYVADTAKIKNLVWSIKSNHLLIGYPNYSGKSTLKYSAK